MRLIFALVIAAMTLPVSATEADDSHVAVSLVSEQNALVPGTTAWLGLHLQHAPHWHTYWINPGDSGLPTTLAWQLPAGFHAGAIAWPAPARIAVDGLYNFGYEGDLLLPVPVMVPGVAEPGRTAHLAVMAKWLVCHETCVPGKAQLALDLPVRARAAPDSRVTKLFADARAALPRPAPWSGEAHLAGDRIEVLLRGADLPAAAGLDAFAQQAGVVGSAPPHAIAGAAELKLDFAKNDYFTTMPASLALVLTDRMQHARSVSVPFVAAGESPQP